MKKYIIGGIAGALFMVAVNLCSSRSLSFRASTAALSGDSFVTERPKSAAQDYVGKKALKSFGSKDEETENGLISGYAADLAGPPRSQVTVIEGRSGSKGLGGSGAVVVNGIHASEVTRPEARTRAWFPETFLFEPLVVTNAQGTADVAVTVPDRLTTWRVLALAHSRDGLQAGSVASFQGTLPVHVDPVVPAFLHAGDEVRLPIQIVNTTDEKVGIALDVEAAGATITSTSAIKQLGEQGSGIEYVTLKAEQPGNVTFQAKLEGRDAVVRRVPVYPLGRPVEAQHGGTLAAPRDLTLTLPDDALAQGASARLLVYPGALALVRSELAAAGQLSGGDADAYALLMAGRGSQLLTQLGETPDAEPMRLLKLLATQRTIRVAQSPDVVTSAMLLEALAAHEDNPVLSRLSERLATQLAAAQRPDGTFSGQTGWTLQRLLVVTAESAHALRASTPTNAARQRASLAALKAQGAFERNFGHIEDAYTAAAIVASGVLPPSVADKLRAVIRAAIQPTADGGKHLVLDPGVVRADGHAPSEVEAAALAVLALDGKDDAALRADLGSTVLGGYLPGLGWGDARTNFVALRAAVELFKKPLPGNVQVQLLMDGNIAAEGVLDPQHAREVMAMQAPLPKAAGAHHWTVRATPAVAGLGFSLMVSGYAPWHAGSADGLELQTQLPSSAKVGEAVELTVTAATPANESLKVRQALPAGVQPQRSSLDALVSAGTISSYDVADGYVELRVPPQAAGHTFSAKWQAVPTLSGTLHAAASSVALADRPTAMAYAAPLTWHVK